MMFFTYSYIRIHYQINLRRSCFVFYNNGFKESQPKEDIRLKVEQRQKKIILVSKLR